MFFSLIFLFFLFSFIFPRTSHLFLVQSIYYFHSLYSHFVITTMYQSTLFYKLLITSYFSFLGHHILESGSPIIKYGPSSPLLVSSSTIIYFKLRLAYTVSDPLFYLSFTFDLVLWHFGPPLLSNSGSLSSVVIRHAIFFISRQIFYFNLFRLPIRLFASLISYFFILSETESSKSTRDFRF